MQASTLPRWVGAHGHKRVVGEWAKSTITLKR